MARREDAASDAPRGVGDPERREGSRVGGRANPGVGKSAEKNAHNGGLAPAGRDETVRAAHGREALATCLLPGRTTNAKDCLNRRLRT